MYNPRLSYNEIENFLGSKDNISMISSRSSDRKDIYFDIEGQKLGRISVNENKGKYTLWSPIQGKFSQIKEDDCILEQIASRYGVKIFHGENETVYATKEVTSRKDIDSFYDFCLRNKNARYQAGGDQSKFYFGLEPILGFAST